MSFPAHTMEAITVIGYFSNEEGLAMSHKRESDSSNKSSRQLKPLMERDPEKAWKNNPDPWASWENADKRFTKQSFVKEPDWSRYEKPGKGSVWMKEFVIKTVLSAMIFVAVWSLFEYSNSWTRKGQAFVKQALTEEFNFAAAAVWYQHTFSGSPSFLPIFGQGKEDATAVGANLKPASAMPLQDAQLIRTFAELLNGIELAAPSGAPVMAVETGRVIFVSEEQGSVMLQHVNKRITIYTGIQADVKLNEWVTAGDPIGNLQQSKSGSHSLLFFSVKDNDRYVDPLDVIPFD